LPLGTRCEILEAGEVDAYVVRDAHGTAQFFSGPRGRVSKSATPANRAVCAETLEHENQRRRIRTKAARVAAPVIALCAVLLWNSLKEKVAGLRVEDEISGR
jgi:hypothetical protein